jgi:hypothetical protein
VGSGCGVYMIFFDESKNMVETLIEEFNPIL